MLFVVAAQSGSADVLLLSIEGHSGYSRTAVWTGNFLDYTGRQWDLSHLYANHQISVSMNISVLQQIMPNLYLTHNIYGDTGFTSEALKVKSLFGYNPSFTYFAYDDFSITLSLQGFLNIGGDMKEHPCLDDFDRQYHCGTGIPWQDAQEFIYGRYDQEKTVSLVANWTY